MVDYVQLDSSDKMACVNEAAVFKARSGNTMLYRSSEGDWVVGTELGSISKGAIMRSQDPDRGSFIQECPCQTQVWQWRDGNNWITDNKLRVVIRKDRLNINL